nr:hypothetical protein CFP56_00726 [Quercus suber]
MPEQRTSQGSRSQERPHLARRVHFAPLPAQASARPQNSGSGPRMGDRASPPRVTYSHGSSVCSGRGWQGGAMESVRGTASRAWSTAATYGSSGRGTQESHKYHHQATGTHATDGALYCERKSRHEVASARYFPPAPRQERRYGIRGYEFQIIQENRRDRASSCGYEKEVKGWYEYEIQRRTEVMNKDEQGPGMPSVLWKRGTGDCLIADGDSPFLCKDCHPLRSACPSSTIDHLIVFCPTSGSRPFARSLWKMMYWRNTGEALGMRAHTRRLSRWGVGLHVARAALSSLYCKPSKSPRAGRIVLAQPQACFALSSSRFPHRFCSLPQFGRNELHLARRALRARKRSRHDLSSTKLRELSLCKVSRLFESSVSWECRSPFRRIHRAPKMSLPEDPTCAKPCWSDVDS